MYDLVVDGGMWVVRDVGCGGCEDGWWWVVEEECACFMWVWDWIRLGWDWVGLDWIGIGMDWVGLVLL